MIWVTVSWREGAWHMGARVCMIEGSETLDVVTYTKRRDAMDAIGMTGVRMCTTSHCSDVTRTRIFVQVPGT